MKKNIRKGTRKPRVKRPVEKNVPDKYDSNWEHELHNGLLRSWNHHTEEVAYIIEHVYEPDFIKTLNGRLILLEAKGRFWDFAEYSKYIWIKKVLPENTELVFLFANPSSPMPQAKRRKDGTKRSHGEWASANDFTWYSEDSLPDGWVDMQYRKDNTLTIESE